MAADGSWLVILEQLERGDPAFVDSLRACEDAERLAGFAQSWQRDTRPASRRFLLEYLKRPLNAYHHEGLVKRLFKLAEKAGDDEAMAHFLVLFDRSLRRKVRKTIRWEHRTFKSRAEADAFVSQWDGGPERVTLQMWGNKEIHASASCPVEKIIVPRGTAMPRELSKSRSARNPRTGEHIQVFPEALRKRLENFRLFSVHTRHYLRRRTWRYFRNLGRTQPDRYVPAVLAALKVYEDADVADGLAFLDNWGLIHVLFHHSPALWPRSHGWTLQPGHRLGELAPAPAYPELWQKNLRAFLDLLKGARCRPVRQWVLHFLRLEPAILGKASVEDLFDLLKQDLPEIVALAAQSLRGRPDLAGIAPDRWLELIGHVSPAALDVVCALIEAVVLPERLTLEQMVNLACGRPLPVARLGFRWLQQRDILASGDVQALWRLAEAQAEPLRAEMVRWAHGILSRTKNFEPAWVLDFLDSRHEDVRAEGWAWLLAEPRAANDVHLWQRLFESPYDDVRLKLIAHLENRFAGRTPALPSQVSLDPELVRLLWATLLLNIHRGNRAKPVVVGQMVGRLAERPDDAPQLLPLLKVALRSLRGPEWRAGLAGVVRLVERRPDMAELVEKSFPELQLVEKGG